MSKLIDIEGIGEAYAAKLRTIGIETQEQLLEQGGQPEGRQRIAERTGINPSVILSWLNRADLARVKGIGEEYADLLESGGVDTVSELARRNAKNLCEKLAEVNAAQKLVRNLPSENKVAAWIEQAKTLDRLLFY